MRINRGIFVDSAQIGEHKVETISDGHTIFTWMGTFVEKVIFNGEFRYYRRYSTGTRPYLRIRWNIQGTDTPGNRTLVGLNLYLVAPYRS